jgi:spore coat protein U-like protein
MNRTTLSRLALAMTASLMGSSAALANKTATSNFDVSIQVMSTCSISASNMTFSSITTGTTSNTDASASLTVNCSSGTPYTISLGDGQHYSGGRRMSNGTTNINYYLYSDSTRSSQWNSVLVQSGTGTGTNQSIDVFGRVPAGQSVVFTGGYADTVVATVTY